MASIYQEFSDQVDSTTNKSENSSQFKSSVHTNSSIVKLAKSKLLDYSDIKDELFQLLPHQISSSKMSDESQFYSYMTYHATEVPIGQKFQAKIPMIMSSKKYIERNMERLESLKLRKIHSPEEDNSFFQANVNNIKQVLPFDLTYQDIILIKNNFVKKSLFQDFLAYLNSKQVYEYWEDFFNKRRKAIGKNKRRRRRFR